MSTETLATPPSPDVGRGRKSCVNGWHLGLKSDARRNLSIRSIVIAHVSAAVVRTKHKVGIGNTDILPHTKSTSLEISTPKIIHITDMNMCAICSDDYSTPLP